MIGRKRERERQSERGTRCGEEECGLQERESVVAKADRSADHPELALRLRWVWTRAGRSCLLASLRFALLCARLASPLLSSPLSCESLSLLVPIGIPRSPPSLPVSTRSLQPGYPADSRNRIEILLRAEILGSPADYGRWGEKRSRTESRFGKYLGFRN